MLNRTSRNFIVAKQPKRVGKVKKHYGQAVQQSGTSKTPRKLLETQEESGQNKGQDAPNRSTIAPCTPARGRCWWFTALYVFSAERGWSPAAARSNAR